MKRAYQYRARKKRRAAFIKNRLSTPDVSADPVPLTGLLGGKPATDLEERFGRALQTFGLEFMFQMGVATPHSPPGVKKVVDFVVLSKGIFHPIEVDGQIGHRTSGQRGEDAIREMLLNMTFAKWGYLPLQRVKWYELETQEMADAVVRRMFG